MKKLMVGAAMALMLAGGCASKPLIPPSAAVVVAQGDTSLDAAYNTVAKIYLQSTNAPLKAQAKPILQRLMTCPDGVHCSGLLVTIDTAERLGSAGDLSSQIAQAEAMIGQVRAILAQH